MLLCKQTMSSDTRQHFGLLRDPFRNDIQSHEDVYFSPSTRYVYESLWHTAQHGGILAVVAESGAGKTTLLHDLEDRIAHTQQPILIIKPYVLAMDDSEQKGKALKAIHIAEAIMARVAPLEKLKRSTEARFGQLHQTLCESHRIGYHHCLVIDEAHALPMATIRHLKRFAELAHGFKKLLSVILIGQPELKLKLSERNQDVREMVQRCEMIELAPLEHEHLNGYLQRKFERINKSIDTIIDTSGLAALHAKLTLPLRSPIAAHIGTNSLLYPVAVGNLLVAAMNLAA